MTYNLKAVLEKRIVECLEFADIYPNTPINLLTLQLNKHLLKQVEEYINHGQDAGNLALRAYFQKN